MRTTQIGDQAPLPAGEPGSPVLREAAIPTARSRTGAEQ